MMMLDADSLVGLVVEDHENRVFEIMGFYMVLDSPNPITYIKLKDLDKKTFLNKVVSKFKSIDLLINNAGISQRSKAYETDLNVDRKIMEVNYFGTIALDAITDPSPMIQPGLICAPKPIKQLLPISIGENTRSSLSAK